MIYKHTLLRPKAKSTKEPHPILVDFASWKIIKTHLPLPSYISDLVAFWCGLR